MASLIGGLFLAYLLSASFTDQVQLNVTPVQKLVDYQYNLDFSQIVPGEPYTGSITANWAVPPSALLGMNNGRLSVKVTASADQNSTVYFLASGAQAKEATVFLRCDVANGSCAATSVLSATIPVTASAKPDASELATISLRSEIANGSPPMVVGAGSIFDSLSGALSGNSSSPQGNSTIRINVPSAEQLLANSTNFSQAEDFLDSLKPEGDSKNPVQFLQENPLVSLTALVIVIAITGAYLLNAKD